MVVEPSSASSPKVTTMGPPSAANTQSTSQAPKSPLPVSTSNKWHTSKHYSGTVTILVDAAQKAFVVHKELLCFYSDYFRKAFTGSSEEASENKITLSDVSVEIFEAFQHWLYTRRLEHDESDSPNAYVWLAKLWVFGNLYHTPLLQNNAMDAIFAAKGQTSKDLLSAYEYALQNSASESHLRKRFADMTAYLVMKQSPSFCVRPGYLDYWTKESLADVLCIVATSDKDTLAYRVKKNECYYHVHADGEHC